MDKIIISEEDYRDKVYGCWLGKSIGGTLGAPYEGKKELNNLTFYGKLPDGPAENDDLDLQLLWLHAIEGNGIDITAADLGEEWLSHVNFPWDEYGYGIFNLRRGLKPPITGSFNNWFTDCMGSPIRSEIWAALAPGDPQLAATMAYQDAIVDHGREGVFGEMFFAALESAAFVISDVYQLLDIGLAMIPEDCRVSRAIRDAIGWYKEGNDWKKTRELILERYGHYNMTDAPQNLGFITLGWLYGEGDFGKSILTAVNCGYDTDCTGATLASILGIILGAENIPADWVKPIGDRIKMHHLMSGMTPPKNLSELTDKTCRYGKEVIAKKSEQVIISVEEETTKESLEIYELLRRGDATKKLASQNRNISILRTPSFEISVDYERSQMPIITYDKMRDIRVTVKNISDENKEGEVSIEVPEGWEILLEGAGEFSLSPQEEFLVPYSFRVPEEKAKLQPSNKLTFNVRSDSSIESTEIVLIGEGLWYIASPFENDEEGIGFDTVYGPEENPSIEAVFKSKSGEEIKFWRHSFPESQLNMNRFLPRGKPGVVYALGYIWSPKSREARIVAACSDGIKVWMNDELIISKREAGPVMPATHRPVKGTFADVSLKEGWNKFLLKVARYSDSVETHFLIAGEDKQHIPDLVNTYPPDEV